MAFRLTYLQVIMAHSKGEGQGYAYFDCKYRANGDRLDKHCYCQQIESRMGPFHWYIYISPWPILKVKIMIMQISFSNISKMVAGKHYNFHKI